MTPGIFTLFCTHGISYGFSLTEDCESPRTPFDIFKTRFKKAPSTIIYDNACKLHSFCLNREPDFFKNTLFLVDRFHYRGHKACSLGYCCDLYLSFNHKIINTSVNEQANSSIQKLKPQLSYMKVPNFMKTLSLFFCVKNYYKNKTIG